MKRFSRVIAFAICLIMVVGMLPAGVFAAGGLSDIDFTKEADAGKYEIIGQTSAAVAADGLALVTTTSGIEPAGRNITQEPVDLVQIPVAGDWTATLECVFDTNGAGNGYYQFFGRPISCVSKRKARPTTAIAATTVKNSPRCSPMRTPASMLSTS